MQLTMVHIKNFCSCKDVRIDNGTLPLLVGAKNSGSTAAFQALDFLFSTSLTTIGKNMFWNGDVSLQIWVEALFDYLSESEEHDDKLKPYLRQDGTFHIARSACWERDEKNTNCSPAPHGKFIIRQHFCVPVPKLEWLQESRINETTIEQWCKNKEQLRIGTVNFLDYLETTKPDVTAWKNKAAEFIRTHPHDVEFQDTWTVRMSTIIERMRT